MDDRFLASPRRCAVTEPRARRSLWLGALALTVLIGSCAGDESDSPPGAASSDGAQLYATRCASCHGTDLRGTDVGPSQLSEIYAADHHPDDSFRAAIREGVTPHHWEFGPMPAISGLDDDEITAIIAFVRDAQEQEGFEPYPPE